MPTYELTSPKTGQSYRVQADGQLSPEDAESAVAHFDGVYERNTQNKPFFSVGDTLSGIGDAVGALPLTTLGAYHRMREGFKRPDQYDPEAQAVFDAEAKLNERMQRESQNRLMRGEASSTGDAFRAAAPSLGSTVGTMAAAVPAGMASGMAYGALAGTAVEPGGGTAVGGLGGAVVGGIGSALAAGGTAYRMAGTQFLNDAFTRLEQVHREQGKPFTEQDRQKAYEALRPLAENSALWEAGPEAVTNALTLGTAKLVFGLGKPLVKEIAKTTLGKLGIKAGAVAGDAVAEVAGETATSISQAPLQAQAEAYAQGNPNWRQEQGPYAGPGGVMQAMRDVTPATLAMQALTLGAAGGVKAATLPFQRAQSPAPAQTAPTPGLEEDLGDLTAEDIVDFSTNNWPGAGAVGPPPGSSRVTDGGSIPPLATVPGFRDDPLSTAPAATGDVITDLRIPRSPEAIAESNRIENERLAAAARLRNIDAKAQGMPLIPDSPSGSRDILDFANENPIYLPPGFSEQRNLPEYEGLKEAKLPPYWRQFIASGKRGGNPSEVAQRAFDAGLIAEPSADAYFEALRGGISGRQQYRVQFKQREQALAAEEKRVVDFEKTQDKLARKRKEPATPVSFEDIVPGDQMTIDGEPAVVRNVEYNEDGYLTNVVIEDGKRFGLMQFDPQSRSGLLVDEFQPAPRRDVAADEFAPEENPPPPLTPTLPPQPQGVGQTMSDPFATLMEGTESTRPMNRGETARPQTADPLAELGAATRAGEANQAQGRMEPLMSPANRLGRGLADLMPGRVSQSPSLPVSPSQSLSTAYTTAARGSSSQMVPIRAVYEAARAQNPQLTVPQFLAQVQAADAAGQVLLEPFDSPASLTAAGEFTLRNSVGVPSVNMMVVGDTSQSLPVSQSPSLPVSPSPPLDSPASQRIIAANQARNEAALKALGLPTQKGTRIWGREKVAEALRRISRDANQPATLRFMSRLLSRMPLGNLLLKIEADARLNYAGLYQPMAAGRGEISLNTRRMSRGEATGQGDVVESLVHEVLHHVTYNTLRNPKTAAQKQAKADLEALRKRALAALSAQEMGSQFDYELSNVDEFISALFTRADFQSALASIPLDAAPRTLGQRVRTMLDEVFRILAELVTGQKVEAGSVLEASFAAALRIMEDGSPSVQSRIQNAILTQGPGIVSLTRAALRSIRAFHGTPHKVDKFTTAKIGTGEGAQAYGWGLYFAQGKAVAEEYQKTLGRKTSYDGKPYDNTNPRHIAASLLATRGREMAFAHLDARIELDSSGPQAKLLRATRKALETDDVADRTEVNTGNLYTVELIPDEADFLDWDKPLSEQSEKVKAALAALPKSPGDIQQAIDILTPRLTAEGRQAGLAQKQIDQLKVRLGDVNASSGAQFYNRLGEAAAVSEMLAKAGIPGIKYLDAGSRGKGDGSRNFVVFDEKDIRITEENGQPVPLIEMQGSGTSQSLPVSPSPSLASPAAPTNETRETQSRFASPNPEDNLYDTEPVAVAQAEGKAWLAQTPVETAIQHFEQAVVPPGMTQARMFYAHAELIQRLVKLTETGSEVQRMQADALLLRASRAWHGRASQEWGRAGKARAVGSGELATIETILAAKELLVDQAEAKIGPRFEGGTEGVTERIITIIKYVDRVTGETLTSDLRPQAGTAGTPARLRSKHPKLDAMLNKLRKKLYPGMSWAHIFTELPGTQKDRQREIYRRLMLDERLSSLTQDERLALTNELDKAWQRERRKVFMRELKKADVLGEKDAKDREKVAKATPRLLRLMNLGMLNSELFREALAQEYGVRQITPAIAAELRALGERIQTAPEGLPRRKLEQQLVEKLQSLVDATLWQTLDSYWTASVLSGWRTQVDIGLSIANGIEDVGLGSVVTAIRTGNKDVAVRALGALFGRLPSAFLEAVDHIATGNKAMMRNFELETKQAMEGGNRLASDVGAAMWKRGGWRAVPGGFMVFYGRMLTALDHINSASTREGALAMALARHPELYQKALRITPSDRAVARKQARQELTLGSGPANRQQRLEEDARVREILEQGTPPELLDEALEVGRRAALQGEPTGIGGTLLDAVLSAVDVVNRKATALAGRENADAITKQGAKVTGALVPFVRALTGTKFARTVAHALNRNLSYVPGVGVYAVGQQGRTGAFADILMARQIIGTLVGIAAYLAFDDDEDEKGIEDGWKDKTPQQKAQLYAQGKQPFTVWGRDAQGRVVSYNYQQWGIAGIMNTVAAMLKQKNSEAGTMNVLTNSLIQGAMSFTDKAQLQGLQTVFGDNYRSTDPAAGIASNLNKWAAQTVGGLVPRIAKDIDNEFSPELRSTSQWWQRWAKEVPMVRQLSSGKRVDILGEDIKLDRGPLSRVRQIGTADPAYRTLGLLNSRDIYLPDPSTGVRIVRLADGTRRPMTPNEKDRYQRLTGQSYRQLLTEKGPQLLQMDPEDAKDYILKTTKRLRDRAAVQAVR